MGPFFGQTRSVADALERITNLVALLLETRAPLTLQQISDELSEYYPANESAARGAFERDKALLRDIGVPLESEVLSGADAGKTAYRIDRRRYELTDLHLTDDERAALELAAATVRLADARFGMLKLGGGDVEHSPVVANVPDLPALPALREATAARSEVTFDYRGTGRRLHPFALLLREGFWYVIGHDLGHDEVRTYRVDRIEGAVAAGPPAAFERPAGFDPRAAFPTDAKMLGDSPAHARVVIDAARASAAARELGADAVLERRADGSVVVEVPYANVFGLASWLFGWGGHAEVIGPPDAREFVVGWLRSLVAT
jgi:proteasome accessory factor B